MPKSKAPWWMYVVACSYAVYFGVTVYMAFWGPEWIGITPIQDGDRVLIKDVLSDSQASRAGLRSGDQIVAAAGHHIHNAWDWYAVTFNVSALDSVPVRLIRDGEQLEHTLIVSRRNWQSINAISAYGYAYPLVQLAYLAIAFMIAFSRPFNIHARLGALFLASAVTPMTFPDGLGAVIRELPPPLQVLLWVQTVLGRFGIAAFFAFCATFPKPVFRARSALVLCLAPIFVLIPFQLLHVYRLLYLPNPTGAPAWLAASFRSFGSLMGRRAYSSPF